jgi:hypothetical protein
LQCPQNVKRQKIHEALEEMKAAIGPGIDRSGTTNFVLKAVLQNEDPKKSSIVEMNVNFMEEEQLEQLQDQQTASASSRHQEHPARDQQKAAPLL